MDKNLQNIEDLFKKGLGRNEESPSEKVWNQMEQSLEKENSLKFRKKYDSLKRATALLLVLVALLCIYVLRNESQKTAKQKNENVAKAVDGSKKELAAVPNYSTATIKKEQKERNIVAVTREGKSNRSGSVVNERVVKGNNADENLKTRIESISRARAFDKKSIAAEPSEKAVNQPVNKPFLKEEEKHAVMINSDHSVIKDEAFNFELPPIPSFNSLKNRKELNRISPYIMPGKLTPDKPTIHITRPPQFDAGIFYSPTIPFSHLRDEDRNYRNPYARELEKRESGTYSYSFGFSIGYSLTDKWSLQSGISLSTLNIHIEPEKVFAERDNRGTVKYPINTSSGKAYILPSFNHTPRIGDSLFTRNIKHSLQYTAFPLVIKYHVTFGRLSANLLAGLSGNVLSKGKISTEVKSGNDSELEKTHDIQGLKPFYFNAVTGIGFDYNLYKNVSLTFSPTFNFAIEPINKNVPVSSYPGSIDFQFGLKTKF